MKLVNLILVVGFAVAGVAAYAGGSELVGHVFGLLCGMSVLCLCQPRQ